MEIVKTPIEGLLIIKPDVFEDARGYFFESYNRENFSAHGIDVNFVQDNESKSGKDVLRGLHFQDPPYAQGKLVRVMQGSVLDVAVDIRKGSPTYGKWASIELSGKTNGCTGSRRDLHMGFSPLKIIRSSSINARMSIIRKQKDVSSGMIRTLTSTGELKTR